jgi:hypothetical protein
MNANTAQICDHGKLISDLHDRLGIRLDDLAHWGGVSYSTVRAWSDGDNGGPGWQTLCLWAQSKRMPTAAKLRIGLAMWARSGLRLIEDDNPTEAEMDADKDGDIDHHDAARIAARKTKLAGMLMDGLAQSQSQSRIYEDQIAAAREAVYELEEAARLLRGVLDKIEAPKISRRLTRVAVC